MSDFEFSPEIQAELENGLESLDEMMESAKRVKGGQFYMLVRTVFDLLQFADLAIKGIRISAGDDDVEIQGPVLDCFANLSSNISHRLHGDLSQQDIDEAYALATTIHHRKMDLEDQIQSRMRGA